MADYRDETDGRAGSDWKAVMSTFDGRLHVPGHSRVPLGVDIDVSNERLTLTAGGSPIADWALESVDVTPLRDGFHIRVDGEEIVLNVSDAALFGTEVGIARSRPERVATVAANGGQALRDATVPSAADQAILETEHGFAPPARSPVEELGPRISEVARALRSPSMSPADAFQRWLSLARELNHRLGDGTLDSAGYHRLNGELLALMPGTE